MIEAYLLGILIGGALGMIIYLGIAIYRVERKLKNGKW